MEKGESATSTQQRGTPTREHIVFWMEVMRRMMGRPKRPFNKEDTVLLVLPPARISINTQKIFLRYNDIPHVNGPTFGYDHFRVR